MKALIIVDVQYDFTTGGKLEVPAGEKIISKINRIQGQFDLVVASQDWHPQNHISFASNHKGAKAFDVIRYDGGEQILWPDHCVQGSKGASLRAELDQNRIEAIFRKGTNPRIDSYSAFYDNRHRKTTGLGGYLREKAVGEVYVCGLAADICVYFTARDSQAQGFNTYFIEDASAYLNMEDFASRKRELIELGVVFLESADLLGVSAFRGLH